jgi:mitotic spindle assembly checkpoint protein MAD2
MNTTQQSVKTENAVTLKGSAKMVSEFFHYGINSILYQRGVYPPEDFTRKQEYGLTLLVTTDKAVNQYLENVLRQTQAWLESRRVRLYMDFLANIFGSGIDL